MQLLFDNFSSLFDDWVNGGGRRAKQFAELEHLEGLNAMLQGQVQSSRGQFLTLKFKLPNLQPIGVRGCRFSHDGKQIVSTSDDGSLMVWEASSVQKPNTLHRRRSAWDDSLCREQVVFDGHAEGVRSCDFGVASKLVVSASADCTLKIWYVESEKVMRTLPDHAKAVNDCCFSLNGKLIVSASDDGTLKIWEVENNKPPRTLGDSVPVNCCAFGNDGKWIISGSSDGTLKIWEVESGKLLDALPGHSGAVKGCGFSDKSRKIVSASADGTLNIWDADSRDTQPRTLKGHLAAVNGCCFSTDGKLIVSASSDKTIKVWEVETEQCRATFIADGEMFCCAMHSEMVVAGGALGVYFLQLVT